MAPVAELDGKHISTSSKKKDHPTYHTFECRYFKDTTKMKKASEEELKWHDAELCWRCEEIGEQKR